MSTKKTKQTSKRSSAPRVEWDDEILKREFEVAVKKGYLVVPSSRIEEVEICNLAFEPAGRLDLPECGHVVLRLKTSDDVG